MRARGKDPDFVAIVILLRKLSHPVTEERLKGAAGRAWNVDWNDPSQKAHVIAKKNVTFVTIEGHMLNVVSAARPYIKQREEIARDEPNPSVRETILNHNGWLSVDYVAGSKPKASTMVERYRWVAKLAAELVDEECLGICIPEEEVIVPASAELRNSLREFGTVRGFVQKCLLSTVTVESLHKSQS